MSRTFNNLVFDSPQSDSNFNDFMGIFCLIIHRNTHNYLRTTSPEYSVVVDIRSVVCENFIEKCHYADDAL